MDNSAREPVATLDRIAVSLSGLCLLHCLAMPVLLVILPMLGQMTSGHLHAQMLIVVIPISVIALFLGFRQHGNPFVIAAGIAGMLLLTAGGTVVHSRYGLVADRGFAMAGALTLAVAHFYNSRLARHRRDESTQGSRA